jgi:hypothetical protein
MFIEELIEWFRKSKHQKSNTKENQQSSVSAGQDAYGSVYAKQEIMKLQALYYEERRKCQDLQA